MRILNLYGCCFYSRKGKEFERKKKLPWHIFQIAPRGLETDKLKVNS
jgi:hypothetical protein